MGINYDDVLNTSIFSQSKKIKLFEGFVEFNAIVFVSKDKITF